MSQDIYEKLSVEHEMEEERVVSLGTRITSLRLEPNKTNTLNSLSSNQLQAGNNTQRASLPINSNTNSLMKAVSPGKILGASDFPRTSLELYLNHTNQNESQIISSTHDMPISRRPAQDFIWKADEDFQLENDFEKVTIDNGSQMKNGVKNSPSIPARRITANDSTVELLKSTGESASDYLYGVCGHLNRKLVEPIISKNQTLYTACITLAPYIGKNGIKLKKCTGEGEGKKMKEAKNAASLEILKKMMKESKEVEMILRDIILKKNPWILKNKHNCDDQSTLVFDFLQSKFDKSYLETQQCYTGQSDNSHWASPTTAKVIDIGRSAATRSSRK